MRGSKFDVLGGHIERASQKDNPANRFVFDDLLTKPWLGTNQQVGEAEIVLSRRNIPFMVINNPQGILTTIQNENFQITLSGGIASLPNHEGSMFYK